MMRGKMKAKKFNTRRIISLLIAAVLTASLAGCAGGGSTITVVSRETGSGTRGAFVELFDILEKDSAGNKTDTTTKESLIVNKTDVMITNVSSDPNAIGYISLGSLNDSVQALKIDGTQASGENIKNGTYKISRPFIIATNGVPAENSASADFIAFVMSKQGQEEAAKSYIATDNNAKEFTSAKPGGKLVIAGSSSVYPLMEKLKEAYNIQNPNLKIEIQQSDSSTGINAAIEKTCDIAMSSRDLKDTENALTPTTIALDGIAVIVNKENKVNNMTSDTVKKIYKGEILSWDSLS